MIRLFVLALFSALLTASLVSAQDKLIRIESRQLSGLRHSVITLGSGPRFCDSDAGGFGAIQLTRWHEFRMIPKRIALGDSDLIFE